MQTSHQATAHSLYVLYQALPEQSRQSFLEELLGEQAELLMGSLPNNPSYPLQPSQQRNHFADICGILTAPRSVSLEEMEQVISQQAGAFPHVISSI